VLNRRRNVRKRAESSGRWQLIAQWPWRRIGAIGLALLGVAALCAPLLLFLNQPIERIRVDGQFQHMSALDVEKAVRAQLHGAGLVSVRLDDVRRALRMLPWVRAATVQRSWPRGLAVTVTEQQAVARWNSTDLVNERGDMFSANAHFVPPELPQLAGPPGTEAEVVARYLAVQGRIVESGVHLSSLSLDARGAWELKLDNGVTVRFGRRQVDERFERFLSVALHLICQRAADIAYVDMRYTNGFAVGWRAGAGKAAGLNHAQEGKADG
jgi:cell division protein FtsQ